MYLGKGRDSGFGVKSPRTQVSHTSPSAQHSSWYRNPKPSTQTLIHPPNPKPKTLNPKPKTQNPKPKTQNPKPKTQNPKPQTQNPKPKTLNPKPVIPDVSSLWSLDRQGARGASQALAVLFLGIILNFYYGITYKVPENDFDFLLPRILIFC